MRALVVFESMFGNTQGVAEAIAEGLRSHASVETVEVSAAPIRIAPDVALVVVGGPTHAFGLSRSSTRHDAATRTPTELVSAGIGLREWLELLDAAGSEAFVATFDTRIRRPRLPGSAAKAAEKRLREMGLRAIVRAESFWVKDTMGPLFAGELDRARAWGSALGVSVAAAVTDLDVAPRRR